VTIYAYVQDAVTGQNATTLGGSPAVASACEIQPTGFSQCIVGAPYFPVVPSAPHYKVTLFVTKNDMPCPLENAGCGGSSQLLAPPSPTVTGDF
jgi:hypothetical protein